MPRAMIAAPMEGGSSRLIDEPASALRSPYQRDRDRILHSTAFRRLQAKTQVFVHDSGDHFRTRLTHSLEVAQVARTIARALEVDEDLAETIALAHDLGHSPFGHAGEEALNRVFADAGGFDHNVQTLRVVTRLERRYPTFDGLNLTHETLDGVIKHNGPWTGGAPPIIEQIGRSLCFPLACQGSLECQIAALSDDVAYLGHDMDDGFRAGFFSLDDIAETEAMGPIVAETRAAYTSLDDTRIARECLRRLIDRMVHDVIGETRRRLTAEGVHQAAEVRICTRPLVGFSQEWAEPLSRLKGFLHQRVYRHYKVNRMAMKAQRILHDLAEHLLAYPSCLPTRWQERLGDPGSERTASAVRDYLAGMTDRYALEEHERLLGLTRLGL
ncbi:MAG: deoxyguanosinetriphosphate triphosphohydrolase [Geminicoccaceae bacterium]